MNKESAWYLIQCKPRQENRAKEHLENQSIKSFFPVIDIEKVVRGRRTTRLEPLFPGYIFVELDTDSSHWSKIRSTRGVRDFVRFGGVPGKVSEELIDELASMEKKFVTNIGDETPKSGDRVVITKGPFRELEGVFQIQDGEKRSIILLSLMGKQTRLKVLNSDIERA